MDYGLVNRMDEKSLLDKALCIGRKWMDNNREDMNMKGISIKKGRK